MSSSKEQQPSTEPKSFLPNEPLKRHYYLLSNGRMFHVIYNGKLNLEIFWSDGIEPIVVERKISQEEARQMCQDAAEKRAGEKVKSLRAQL